jgi:hypothetical protein
VRAYGSSTVTAYDSSTVTACDSSTVTACDSSTVRAYDSSTVRAYGSSTVTAYDSSTVTACDSSTVTACDSSTVTAYDSSTVTAGSHTAVHLHSGYARIEGGVIIDHTAVNELDAQTWCDYHGVTVVDGVATLYKAVNDQWTTSRGTDYSPDSTPSCDDFEATNSCGHGLHFSPTPGHALYYLDDATKFVSVGVRVDELQPVTGDTAKCKAPGVATPCVEVDVHGRPAGA